MHHLTRYDPFAETGFDEIFRGCWKPLRASAMPVAASIRMDVTESDKGYVVHAEIPGARKEDVNVSIEGNQVTIGAEIRRVSDEKDGERVLRSERYYGSAYRSFTVPVELDEGASTAKFENGVLELTLARKAAAVGTKLNIQ